MKSVWHKMPLNLIHFLLISYIHVIEGSVEQQMYVKMTRVFVNQTNHLPAIQTKESKIECFLKCVYNTLCTSTIFTEDNECYLMYEQIPCFMGSIQLSDLLLPGVDKPVKLTRKPDNLIKRNLSISDLNSILPTGKSLIKNTKSQSGHCIILYHSPLIHLTNIYIAYQNVTYFGFTIATNSY